MLADYVSGGGRLLVMAGPVEDGILENLYSLLSDYGVEANEGIVVEADREHYAFQAPYVLLPDMASHDITDSLIEENYFPILPISLGLTVTGEGSGSTVTELLTTSDAAFSKVAGYDLSTYEKEEGDIDGPFSLAVYAREEASGAEVIWLGCSNMDDEALYLSVPANCDFLVGCAASLAGQRSDLVIDPKAMEAALLTIPAGTAAAAGITFLLAVPVGLLAAGAVVSLRRRRR